MNSGYQIPLCDKLSTRNSTLVVFLYGPISFFFVLKVRIVLGIVSDLHFNYVVFSVLYFHLVVFLSMVLTVVFFQFSSLHIRATGVIASVAMPQLSSCPFESFPLTLYGSFKCFFFTAYLLIYKSS